MTDRHEEKARELMVDVVCVDHTGRLCLDGDEGAAEDLTAAISAALRDTERETAARVERETMERCAGVCEARAAEWRDRVATLSTAKYAADEAADCAFVLRSLLPTEDGNG